MDPDKVFKEYVNLCSENAGHLQYYLAQNAILEWFGRTLRGTQKIKNFVRYELSKEYKQQFNEWKFINAFETLPTHFETKVFIASSASPELKISQEIDKDFLNRERERTPEDNIIRVVKLPELHQGRRFLPECDSDEDDFEELGISKLGNTTIPSIKKKNFLEIDIKGRPPIKKIKCTLNQKLFSPKDRYNFIHLKSKSSTVQSDSRYISNTQNSESNSKFDYSNSKYSDLYYIEGVGKLITLSDLTHYGTQHNNNKTDTEKVVINMELNDPESSASKEDVNLKISYRVRLDDSRIEFALIIYEHSRKMSTARRNLLSAFTEADGSKNKSISNSKLLVNPESKKKSKKKILKRLRIF